MVNKRTRISTFTEQHAFKPSETVVCLGLIFPDDNTRREYFLDILREKLKDPEFRKIEGFPVGSDEDILALSDPPYYTACPNPFFADFIKLYGKPYDPTKPYSREPFAADVSEGKNDPIYNAHSYHTKVPHKAIMRYILHYTEPGDVIFDGFCGTGMTGVAAAECASPSSVFKYQIENDFAQSGLPQPEWGCRSTILTELSPAATFISSNFNSIVDEAQFKTLAGCILDEVEKECGWLFETKHSDGRTGHINFTLWSDVFSCPECSNEIVFWKDAVDSKAGSVRDSFPCPNCTAQLSKKRLERVMETVFDSALKKPITRCKQVPVLINYSVNGDNHRYEKTPDAKDLEIACRLKLEDIPYWYPSQRMMEGQETRRNDPCGITHIHHFYTARNLYVLSALRSKIWINLRTCPLLGMWFTSAHVWATRLNRLLASNYFQKRGGVIGQTLQGTLYISSLAIETNALERFRLRINSVPHTASSRSAMIGTSSTESLYLPSNSIDYIFTDPPFGANIAYSELNHLWESWLGVFTNIRREAIENKAHSKDLMDYQSLMEVCLKENFRVLKPGRWITVEFSNTRAAVWNVIQTTLEHVGFVVANVAALEKTHNGYRAVTTSTAVRQDLVISAYKPNDGLEDRFKLTAGTEEGVWDFIRTHLKQLPVFVSKDDKAEVIAERQNFMLFDRMVAFHVQRGVTVPLSAAEFYEGLVQRFAARDNMFFLPEQVAGYDKKRMSIREVLQLKLFVTDESSAILWLKQQLLKKPQTFQELHPQFLTQIGGWQKHEAMLELSELLAQNFLRYDGRGEVPSRIHRYLSTNFKDLRNLPKDDERLRTKGKDRWYVPDPSQAEDLEKLRERSLLKEFDGYRMEDQKRLKVFRLEAIRAGFKKAWQERDYTTIINVASKIPEKTLHEDPKLLMWYDQALTRSGEDM
jgi:DNA modification methylase/rubredoxin